MKGKRYTTETKIRILREAQSSDKTIQDVCRERQISEQSFHRWKRELGMLELNHLDHCSVYLCPSEPVLQLAHGTTLRTHPIEATLYDTASPKPIKFSFPSYKLHQLFQRFPEVPYCDHQISDEAH